MGQVMVTMEMCVGEANQKTYKYGSTMADIEEVQVS